jgi:hypothetical protein
MIERLGEETLETINDLSEDNRKEFDNVYLALSQLADKRNNLNLVILLVLGNNSIIDQ